MIGDAMKPATRKNSRLGRIASVLCSILLTLPSLGTLAHGQSEGLAAGLQHRIHADSSSGEWIVEPPLSGRFAEDARFQLADLQQSFEQILDRLGKKYLTASELERANSLLNDGSLANTDAYIVVGHFSESVEGYFLGVVVSNENSSVLQVVDAGLSLEDALTLAEATQALSTGQPRHVNMSPGFTECPCEQQCEATLAAGEALCNAFRYNCVEEASILATLCIAGCTLAGNPPCVFLCGIAYSAQLYRCEQDYRVCMRPALAVYKDCLTDCDQ